MALTTPHKPSWTVYTQFKGFLAESYPINDNVTRPQGQAWTLWGVRSYIWLVCRAALVGSSAVEVPTGHGADPARYYWEAIWINPPKWTNFRRGHPWRTTVGELGMKP